MLKQPTEVLKDRMPTAELQQFSDEQLLQEYRMSEDPAVFTELVSRYQRELYNYLRRFLGDGVLAEDVFQTTFLQVHVKRELFESGRRFRPWLYTIATNQAIDAQRRNRRHRRLSLDQAHRSSGEDLGTLMEVVATSDSTPYEAVESGERAEWVRDAVDKLPDPLQNTVRLVYFRGMKYRDAAKVMSVPVGTVKSRLHSAIQRLGQSWRELQPQSTR
ncbi:MAG: RNA polymerase sigma factor [Planctomycetes bacterium]|nr:RNA polymerase sigma factor [Planctomycetota bacterium]